MDMDAQNADLHLYTMGNHGAILTSSSMLHEQLYIWMCTFLLLWGPCGMFTWAARQAERFKYTTIILSTFWGGDGMGGTGQKWRMLLHVLSTTLPFP